MADPRAKLLALLAFLLCLTTLPARDLRPAAMLLALAPVLASPLLGLRFGALLRRVAVVLPFAGSVALAHWLAGDAERAVAVLVRSTSAAWAVLLVASTTPLPRLLAGMEGLGVPRLLSLLVQFVYRYLFVTVEQAGRMRAAAQSRGGVPWLGRRAQWRAWTGLVAVLFAKSLQRAEGVHRAMLARGFQGTLPVTQPLRWTGRDAALVVGVTAGCLGLRWWG